MTALERWRALPPHERKELLRHLEEITDDDYAGLSRYVVLLAIEALEEASAP